MRNQGSWRRMFPSLSTISSLLTASGCRTLAGKFFKRSGPDRRLFLKAFWLLGLAQSALLVFPFRRIAPFLGQVMCESPGRVPAESDVLAARISRAVETAARYTPWESKCLVRAIAVKIMLNRRNIPNTLYLGLANDGEKGLSAHAWIRCGERILTGGPGCERFTVVATFAGDRP